MATAEEIKRFSDVKRRLSQASNGWQLGGTGLELHAVVYEFTPPVCVAELTADCSIADQDFLVHAFDDLRFVMLLLERAAAEVRRWKPAEKQAEEREQVKGNYSAQCVLKCKNDQAFRRFLSEVKKQDVSDEVRTTSAIRYLLKIDSRNELNHDAGARNRWLDLLAEFETWMRVSA